MRATVSDVRAYRRGPGSRPACPDGFARPFLANPQLIKGTRTQGYRLNGQSAP
jgi:hypothetical protein